MLLGIADHEPGEVLAAFEGFHNAPVKKLNFVDGGVNPTDHCLPELGYLVILLSA